MLHLNNKGWGTKEMIIYTSIILFALLVATFYVIRLYGTLDNNAKNEKDTMIQTVVDYEYYRNRENVMERAAGKYISDQGSIVDGITYTVSYNTLREHGYLQAIYDKEDKTECDGYIKVSSDLYSSAYLKCSNYTTQGY